MVKTKYMQKEKEEFTKNKINSITLGEYLVKLRTKNRISIESLSNYTKIQEKYLIALENGNYDKLPTDVYIKGYLREYEIFFNLEENTLVKVFEKEYKIYNNINKRDNNQNSQKLFSVKKEKKIVITPKIFIILSIIVVFFGIIGYLYYGINKFISAPWITIKNPQSNLETNKKTITINGFTQPEATLEIGGKKVFVNNDGSFNEKIYLIPGENLINIKSKNSTGKVLEKNIKIFCSAESQEMQNKNSKIEQKTNSIIILRTKKNNTIVKLNIDNSETKEVVMDTNSQYKFEFKEKIQISTKSAKSIVYILNNEKEKLLSEEKNEIESITFTNKLNKGLNFEQKDDK